ncbi:envelope glycoprotein G [pteropodid alphaherpesvirus 2]|uniref:Envelope glycoprotein G n=1 Tax=pteropodid alphaherpesvirus 2 TaxID=3118716 RepID=A0A510J706_9ALPH|nr:envelope glycoprotein G [pteropodid alphaherpesvirus 2]BBM13236.1 envelope glycoprotein G [pteropodid alphaherpesvirus 2]
MRITWAVLASYFTAVWQLTWTVDPPPTPSLQDNVPPRTLDPLPPCYADPQFSDPGPSRPWSSQQLSLPRRTISHKAQTRTVDSCGLVLLTPPVREFARKSTPFSAQVAYFEKSPTCRRPILLRQYEGCDGGVPPSPTTCRRTSYTYHGGAPPNRYALVNTSLLAPVFPGAPNAFEYEIHIGHRLHTGQLWVNVRDSTPCTPLLREQPPVSADVCVPPVTARLGWKGISPCLLADANFAYYQPLSPVPRSCVNESDRVQARHLPYVSYAPQSALIGRTGYRFNRLLQTVPPGLEEPLFARPKFALQKVRGRRSVEAVDEMLVDRAPGRRLLSVDSDAGTAAETSAPTEAEADAVSSPTAAPESGSTAPTAPPTTPSEEAATEANSHAETSLPTTRGSSDEALSTPSAPGSPSEPETTLAPSTDASSAPAPSTTAEEPEAPATTAAGEESPTTAPEAASTSPEVAPTSAAETAPPSPASTESEASTEGASEPTAAPTASITSTETAPSTPGTEEPTPPVATSPETPQTEGSPDPESATPTEGLSPETMSPSSAPASTSSEGVVEPQTTPTPPETDRPSTPPGPSDPETPATPSHFTPALELITRNPPTPATQLPEDTPPEEDDTSDEDTEEGAGDGEVPELTTPRGSTLPPRLPPHTSPAAPQPPPEAHTPLFPFLRASQTLDIVFVASVLGHTAAIVAIVLLALRLCAPPRPVSRARYYEARYSRLPRQPA